MQWMGVNRGKPMSQSHVLSRQPTAHADKQDWTARHASLPCLEASRLDGLDRVPVQYQKSFWILASDTVFVSICQTQPIFTNTETAMLSRTDRHASLPCLEASRLDVPSDGPGSKCTDTRRLGDVANCYLSFFLASCSRTKY